MRGIVVLCALGVIAGCTGAPVVVETDGGGGDTGAGDGGVRPDARGDTGAADTGTITPDTGMVDPDAGPSCDGVDCTSLDEGCFVGVCDPTDGTCSAQPRAEGATCDDGNLCTPVDVCTSGVCGGAVVDCSAMSDGCNVGMCDPADGSCVAVAVPDTTACDDVDACTTGDVCTSGVCGGAAVDCSASADQCNTAMCNPADGTCTVVPVMDATTCDDGDACTLADACTAGVCGGSDMDCSALDDMCVVGACSSGTCAPMPRMDGLMCDDTNLCSWGDACGAGMCGGTITSCTPRAIQIESTSSTTPAGNPGGGGPFSDLCPIGQVMIGIEARISAGFYDRLFIGYATLCGTVSVTGGAITITPGARVPTAGGRGGYATGSAPVTRTCPVNQVVVGVGGTQAGAITQATLRCAPLTITGSAMSGYGVGIGAAAPIATLGTRVATAFPDTDCPAGQVARGSVGTAGDIVDSLALRCGAIDLDLVTTAPTGGGGGGGVVTDDCPAGQAPIGVTASVSAAFYDQVLTQFSTQCGIIDIEPAAGGTWTVAITPGARVPAAGSRGGWTVVSGGPQTRTCGANQVLVGVSGTGGGVVNQLTLRCAPITVTGDVTNGFSVSYGAVTALGVLGTLASTPFGPTDCPAGTIGSGLLIRAGDIIDGIALRCAEPALVP